MTARDVIERLQSSGFTLEVFGGRLRIAPASRLTPSDTAHLKLHRDEIIRWLAPDLHVPIPRVSCPPLELTDEARELFAWFRDNRDRLPVPPFQLYSGVRVEGMKFYEALAVDIAQGATGPRYRTGALQADLRRLREITESALAKEIAA